MFEQDLKQGLALFSGDPSVVVPAAVLCTLPRNGRGWAYVHTKISANAADTCTVAISGRLNANGGYVALTKSDQATAFSVAQAAGAATETISTVQLMPDMKVVLSGTRTAGGLLKVWIEAVGAGTRVDN